MLKIPLQQGIHSKVETTIQGNQYNFTTNWNDRFGYYSMDVSRNNVAIASGIMLLVGIDVGAITTFDLDRVYCINRNQYNEDLGYTGLGNDGLVVIVEDSDLEG